MINAGYARPMARYNAWQNGQLIPVLNAMDHKDLMADQGGFFGGLLATANHLLWGDQMWMSRFDPTLEPPDGGITESVSLHSAVDPWTADRIRTDEQIGLWAQSLIAADLQGDLTWYSRVMGKEVRTPMAQSVMHFFNHQTHHRGQIHAMLTGMGAMAPVSDLAFMPEEV